MKKHYWIKKYPQEIKIIYIMKFKKISKQSHTESGYYFLKCLENQRNPLINTSLKFLDGKIWDLLLFIKQPPFQVQAVTLGYVGTYEWHLLELKSVQHAQLQLLVPQINNITLTLRIYLVNILVNERLQMYVNNHSFIIY